ncbi:low molecular weight protein arginine phosphatase [Paenibacillus sp. NPDC058071]|uniref:low molecular weight protein arginine phosphatase n=1 Tax=Paenibacillus sp. NPDC058071 TaxID=3346326 RepID=UPI0036DD1E1A
MKRILFVCTGNTCRSPMAEAMLRELAARNGVSLEVRSAGVSTVNGLPVSPHAAETLRRKGIAHTGQSQSLTGDAIGWADLILTMTSGHKRGLLQWFPQAVEKTHTLMEYVNQDETVIEHIHELEQLYSEMHVKQALGQQLSAAERSRLLALEREIPSFDIADPYGGPLDLYRSCANEIERALLKLLDKLRQE